MAGELSRINACTYKVEEGLHYPSGGTWPSPSQAELAHNLCDGQTPKIPDSWPPYYRALIKIGRQFNQKAISSPLSYCGMQELTDISITAGREIAIRYNIPAQRFELRWGTASGLEEEGQDPTNQVTFFHTHPRATATAASSISHSLGDLSALILAYLPRKEDNGEFISIVAGRICGGKLEISSIAIAKNTIYVANSAEATKVQERLHKIIALPQIRAEVRKDIAALHLEVNPAEIARIAKGYQFSPQLENKILAFFRKGPPL